MTKSFAEQLALLQAAIADTPVTNSKPRCMCHNLYLNKCPGDGWFCKRVRCGAKNSKGRSRCKVCGFVRGMK